MSAQYKTMIFDALGSNIDFPLDIFAKILYAQLYVESSFRPDAVSPVGAQGLAQFMPGTWEQWGHGDPFNPEDAIAAQIRYMEFLYGRFGEIPHPLERMKCALASYNAGRGNINRMLAAARNQEGLPASYSVWVSQGKPKGKWQQWWYASPLLETVTGKHSEETRRYIDKIFAYVISPGLAL